MNAVEIEEAISLLAAQDFDAESFPYAFLEAFGNKETTLKRLKSDKKDSTNASDLKDQYGVLQRNNIHILVCSEGDTANTLKLLRETPSTSKAKAKFILTTDGNYFEAEDITTGESVACKYLDFPNHFGFFLPLAGISTVKQIRDSSFDIRATSRLNKLYVELLSSNPDWGTEERRHDMNHFMARLIFCFFAEDTDIFNGKNIFTDTISQMSESNASNTHEVISEIFRSMNTDFSDRSSKGIKNWADKFPYVNGGLFSGSTETPVFSKIARSYLLHVGSLDWTQINPDIFGSMIQAVTDDEERGSLGMHYTSVPNILKVLNPLFLDDLREQLEQAGDNARKLLNLRKRISNIRVFDPACGSGNFLVIAYKNMRSIEAQINSRRDEPDRQSDIALTNFRGIELRDFPAEIARLALIIAEYQCDLLYRGQKLALAEFLPLEAQNWITNGNALTLDWLSICPPTGTSVKVIGDDLFETPIGQGAIDFENEGGETYICGNPPYKGSNWRTKEQTEELGKLFSKDVNKWKALDYVTGWLYKAREYCKYNSANYAFVTTNSICQGVQASMLWPIILNDDQNIYFAHTSFKWANLASHNAGVSVVIVGITSEPKKVKKIFELNDNGESQVRSVDNINAYLLNAKDIFVSGAKRSISLEAEITDGSGALDGGNLILSNDEAKKISAYDNGVYAKYIKPYYGSNEFIKGNSRWCIWIKDEDLTHAREFFEIENRIKKVLEFRQSAGTRAKTAVGRPHKFAWINKRSGNQIIVPTVFSEKREYITAGYLDDEVIINNAASIIHDADLYIFSIVSSAIHMSWVRAISGKLEDRIRYTSSTCFNTFPLPRLTEKNKNDLRRCAEDILIARETNYPASIAELYDPEFMPDSLREAHNRNDEVIERIYIGRRFKNDTERLEKLFDLYTQMTSGNSSESNKKVN